MMVCARTAAADTDCRAVELDFTPSAGLQIVAWIEDAAGNYVDTVYITQTTGLYGLGNRVGIMELKSGPRWPFGARRDALPIWAHRHGLTFPEVVWQHNFVEGQIDTTFSDTSTELYYDQPRQEREWVDGVTQATHVFTDKGRFSESVSFYPPRGDLQRQTSDSADVEQYATLNVFDGVSQATPAGDMPYHFIAALPSLANGQYVLRVEVAKEFDFNATYTETTFPIIQPNFDAWGVPYRGQPSVLYDVPFAVRDIATTASAASYVGYSDIDGVVHPPDATITTDTPGSGASRLRLATDASGALYAIRVSSRPEQDPAPPGAATSPHVAIEPTTADIRFTAPGDDAQSGTVAGYDIRYTMGYSLDEASFASATRSDAALDLVPGGAEQTISLAGLRPGAPYVVGIRPYDNCKHEGPLLVIAFETPQPEVAACGCTSADASGFAIALALFGIRRRRRRRA